MGSGDNPGGNNGPYSWEEDNLIPPEEHWKYDADYWSDYQYKRDDFSKKKKGEEEVCKDCDQPGNTTHTVSETFNESKAVKSLAKAALKDQNVKNEYARLKKRLQEGVNPVNMSSKSTAVASDKVLIKLDAGRYLVQVSKNQVKILGICPRGNWKKVQTFKRLMNKMYDVNLQYNKK